MNHFRLGPCTRWKAPSTTSTFGGTPDSKQPAGALQFKCRTIQPGPKSDCSPGYCSYSAAHKLTQKALCMETFHWKTANARDLTPHCMQGYEGLYRHACTQLNRHTGQVSSQVQLPDTADLRLQVKILRDLRVTLKLRPAST